MKLILAFLLAVVPVTRASEFRQIELSLQVPDSAWKLAIDAVYRIDNELYVISKVSRDPGAMGASVITTARDTIRIPVDDPTLPVKHFVIGRTWNWPNKEKVTFIKDHGELRPSLSAKAVQVYKR